MGREFLGLQLGTVVAFVLKCFIHHEGLACFFRGHLGLKTRGTAGWWVGLLVLGWRGHYVHRTCFDVDPDGTG